MRPSGKGRPEFGPNPKDAAAPNENGPSTGRMSRVVMAMRLSRCTCIAEPAELAPSLSLIYRPGHRHCGGQSAQGLLALDPAQPSCGRPPLDDEHRGRVVEMGVHDLGDVGQKALAVWS